MADPGPVGPSPDAEPGAVEVHLVPLRRRHLRSVMRIEAQVYPHPWTLSLFMSELNLRTSRAYLAARVGGAVVGYAGLMLAGPESHVTTIAVDPAWQRHKIGSRLLAHLLRVSRDRGVHDVTLEVRVSNGPAQAMYRRFGFEEAGVRRGYYAESGEDALIMWAYAVDTPDYLERLEAIEAGIPGRTVVDEGAR
ncbi:MAG TPA: ribosomal protein S18-alanine N-acetyltransferase [Acidimicrobiales bacterium]|nr:ribosomal protein S18-alanine N-acetyltransferase [Acidimicrobiales bacterium]